MHTLGITAAYHDCSACLVQDGMVLGRVALDCVMNAKVRDQSPYEPIWMQPAAGDAGTSLGAALWIDLLQRPAARLTWKMTDTCLGPSYSDAETKDLLRQSKLRYRRVDNIVEAAAGLLLQNKVIDRFRGCMESGPQALGARAILASPVAPAKQSHLNLIKDREGCRPVAPVVLEEEPGNWFVNGDVLPFLVCVYDVVAGKAGQIPAVRHVDGTARVHTINRTRHPLYYQLLCAFARRTDMAVLIHTSFITRGAPVVCTPTPDALAIGAFLLEKA